MPLLRRRRLALISVIAVLTLVYLWQLAGFTPRLPFPQIYHLNLSVEQVESFPDDVFVPINSATGGTGFPVVFTARITGESTMLPR